MRTSNVLMGVKTWVMATVLVFSGATVANAQSNLSLDIKAAGIPLPPASIPLPPADIPMPSANSSKSPAKAILSPGDAENAADAALSMANMFDGAGGGVSGDELLAALQSAADAGQPIALWRLGVMYENGEGVKRDEARAFGYFSRIANEHANTPPRSSEADIVAQSFVKVGEYYRDGLPDAGIPADSGRATALLMHAATYFGDAEAQYEIGRLYIDAKGAGHSSLQGARWLSLAAHKGHAGAQARLGDLLFNGSGIEQQPIEGLMWLSIAHDHSAGTPDQGWIDDLLDKAMSIATPAQRTAALHAAETLGPQLGGGG